MRKVMGLLAGVGTMGVLVIGGTAQAAPTGPSSVSTALNGTCEAEEVCLYYNSNCKGSLIDFSGWVDDFAGYKFLSAGNGKGEPVKNNAAAAKNASATWTARVWFNHDQQGVYDNIAPRTQCQNLQKTYNENASLSWYK